MSMIMLAVGGANPHAHDHARILMLSIGCDHDHGHTSPLAYAHDMKHGHSQCGIC